MHKILGFTALIFLVIVSGCRDMAVGRGETDYSPVTVETISRGAVLRLDEAFLIDYKINESSLIPDKLIITVTDSSGKVVFERSIEEGVSDELSQDVQPAGAFPEGIYTLRLDFYSDEEIFYTETREFFVSSVAYDINSITSYPPVLYPGGGGLFYADTEDGNSGCWLRWVLDGEVIAEGDSSEGYSSIEIEAPAAEGVYNLSLELFPFSPGRGTSYDFESVIKKEIPLYINKKQKSGVNEFGPDANFSNIFHFRGNLINSAEAADVKSLEYYGNPELSVKNGILGYYLDKASSLNSDQILVPVPDKSFDAFSVMLSLIPYNLPEFGSDEIFFAGSDEGSYSVSINVFPDGSLAAEIVIAGDTYSHRSAGPLLEAGRYSSISLRVDPDEYGVGLIWYIDGVPEQDAGYFLLSPDDLSWKSFSFDREGAVTRIFGGGGFDGLIDEFGIYPGEADPKQYWRAMELEYGKSLIYAEGFDGESEDLTLSDGVYIKDSSLYIGPDSYADFPPVFPGFEELSFRIVVSGGQGDAEAVFYVDSDSSEIVRVPLVVNNASKANKKAEYSDIEFSLIFDVDSIGLGADPLPNKELTAVGDFKSIGYRIINNNDSETLEIKSILITRKRVSITDNEINIPSGKNINS